MKIDVTGKGYAELEQAFYNASKALSFQAAGGKVFVSLA